MTFIEEQEAKANNWTANNQQSLNNKRTIDNHLQR